MTAKWQYEEAYKAAFLHIKSLKEENAKLRESLEDQEGYDQMLRDRLRQQTELCVKAETENAKLLDLLRELYFCSRQVGCDKCRYRRSSNGKLCETLDELRELGIEVDDGGDNRPAAD